MTVHSVLNVRAAPEWGNSELHKYTKGTVWVMGPFIPPLPVESCVAAFLWITTYLVSTISTTSITDYICLTVVKLKQSYIVSNSTVGKKFSQ